jgi:hypothetical protein
MAIIHRTATVTPTKAELVTAWLDRQPWGADGPMEALESYRFDDPAGEVGVEAILVSRGDVRLHVPMTYRGAPLDGADGHLITTMHHSVLGERWIYDAIADPVAVGCFVRALRGEQQVADMELWDGDTLLGRRESAVRVRPEPARPGPAPAGVAVVEVDDIELRVARLIDSELSGSRQLIAEWPDGRGAVAALA